MAEYVNTPIQLVEDGATVVFSDEPVRGNPSIVHRQGSGIVTLRGCTDQCSARFRVSFGANIAVPTGETVGPISLAITLQGEALGGATAISTPAAVDEYNNIYVSAYVDVPRGCCWTVGVRNISDIPVNVQNANLIVDRVA